ncbi:hypothetical protein ABPG77_003006, partial [Micractinium sp. CCAP 211/92]
MAYKAQELWGCTFPGVAPPAALRDIAGAPGPRLRCLPATSGTCLDWLAAARAAQQAAQQAPVLAVGQQRQEAAAEAAALAALAAQAAAAVEAAQAEEGAEAAAAGEEPRGEGRWPRAQPLELSEVVRAVVPALCAMLATECRCPVTDPVHPRALRMLTLDVLAAQQHSAAGTRTPRRWCRRWSGWHASPDPATHRRVIRPGSNKVQKTGVPGGSTTKKAGRQEKFRLNGMQDIHGHNWELEVDG